MTAASVERVTAAVRTATAGIAVAVALFLLFRVPLVASFRYALIVLAALEVLLAGRRVLAGRAWLNEAIAVVVKILVLAIAYLAVGGP